jgi:predicted XRE-type DNA-binding protein
MDNRGGAAPSRGCIRIALFSEEDRADKQGRYRVGGQALPRVAVGAEPMSKKRYASVWDAIEDTPAEAENMKLRSALMIVLKEYIKGKGWTQAEAAQRLGVTQPRVSDLMRGKIDLFGLDTLVNMATSVGLKVQMRVREAA